MKLQRIGTGDPLTGVLYWFPDVGIPRPDKALAGPFADRWAAYKWAVEHREAKLTDEQRALWGEALQLAGGLDADMAHLMGLIALVARGRPRDYILKCAVRLVFWGHNIETQKWRHA